MPKITYIEHDGTPHVVDVAVGLTVMQGAFDNDIPGIDADCGGACACATCHIYLEPAWQAVVGAPDSMETGRLEYASDVNENSRLACQIEVTPALEGMSVRMPATQG